MNGSYDLFIIGAGVAGLTAAEEAARLGLSVCVAEKLMFGGLVVNVNHLWPAVDGMPASGSDFAADLMTRVSDLGVTSLFEEVLSLQPVDGAVRIGTGEASYDAGAVIVASGASLRRLGVPGEAEFEHRGVSHCADCDAPLFQDQEVVVVGGGDSALQEALVLSQFCARVHLVHRGASFSARSEFVQKVQQSARIVTRMQCVVEALEGVEQLAGAQLRDLRTGQAELLACTGFFAYVGLEPNTGFLPPDVETHAGKVVVNDQYESSMKNVFAVGAARAGYGGQLPDAMADARIAVAAAAPRVRPA